MSTRATIHFHYGPKNHSGKTRSDAIIYRHSDGYPEGLGADLQRFFDEIRRNVQDTRFSDPSYLAAKWVAWDARQMAECAAKWEKPGKAHHFLDFLSVGIVSSDPGDIEYRYHVFCDGKPTLTCETAEGEPVALAQTAEANP